LNGLLIVILNGLLIVILNGLLIVILNGLLIVILNGLLIVILNGLLIVISNGLLKPGIQLRAFLPVPAGSQFFYLLRIPSPRTPIISGPILSSTGRSSNFREPAIAFSSPY